MPRINVVRRNGDIEAVAANKNITLMEAIRDSGCDELLALCGGVCSCATCHVYISAEFSDHFLPISDDESGLLECSESRNENSRLSCQILLSDELDGLTVVIAPEG